jgi:hypothetical protein
MPQEPPQELSPPKKPSDMPMDAIKFDSPEKANLQKSFLDTERKQERQQRKRKTVQQELEQEEARCAALEEQNIAIKLEMKLELRQEKSKRVALGEKYDEETGQLRELREKQMTAELSIIQAKFDIMQQQQQQYEQQKQQQNRNSSCATM